MKIYKAANYEEMSRKAANVISAQIILQPNSVLGLATGSSPIGLYRQLIERHKQGDLNFDRVKTVNLDEYKGLAPDNPQSYRYFMQKNLFSEINIRPENINLPNGMAEDGDAECRRYNEVIDAIGGIDIQLLGVGHNGHIGFNEPGEVFEKDTHLVKLAESTIQANRRFFESEEDVPRYAYTMGVRAIMHARHILVIVSGKEKAEIVRKAFQGPVTPEVPASILQLHNHVTIVGDVEALALMTP